MRDIKFILKIISKKKILDNEKKISLNSNRIYYNWLKSQKENKINKIENYIILIEYINNEKYFVL